MAVVAAQMAAPNTEAEEEYEYVQLLDLASLALYPFPPEYKTDSANRYEGLPPNFSLAQNMAAGAFAGIAVRSPPSTYQAYGNIVN